MAACRTRFRDRADAGRALAARLRHLAGRPDVVVLAVPRGGVPVGAVVARALGARLHVIVARKLGVPGQPELAMGAVAAGTRVLYPPVVDGLGIGPDVIDLVARREEAEVARREAVYLGGAAPADLHGRVVVLVDDGLATGSTMRAAVATVGARGPARVVVAVPVGTRRVCDLLAAEADEVVCLQVPASFQAVGEWYDDFTQTTDDDIRALLGVKEGDDGT